MYIVVVHFYVSYTRYLQTFPSYPNLTLADMYKDSTLEAAFRDYPRRRLQTNCRLLRYSTSNEMINSVARFFKQSRGGMLFIDPGLLWNITGS